MADEERHTGFQSSPPSQWGQSPHIYPHSHHGTPAQEYSGFNFSTPQMPMATDTFSTSIHQRPMPPPLQPLIMPQWPSMLSSQSHATYQHQYPQPVQPIQPMTIGPLITPVSATSGRSTSTPRKTLTDHDRKRMCLYAEEHPHSKQTEIGAIFGVERSTVSKVLRQKEKYLLQDEGSRSPVKRAKGRSPDIERALAVWAKNHERKGMPLTDEIIRDKARAFAATTPNPENHYILSASWLEKFKLKHNLMGARSRKGSLAPDDADYTSAAASSSHTPSGTSPISPVGLSPELHGAQSQESLKNESPDSYVDSYSGRAPFHSESTNSLHSAYTDTAPSSFSPMGPLSPTSPFFTPDSGVAPNPFCPPLTARPILPATTSTNSQRPRSQTFPLLQLDHFMSGSAPETATPKYAPASTMLDSPMEEAADPLASLNEAVNSTHSDDRPNTVAPADMTMRPPPLPAHVFTGDRKREITPALSATSEASSTTNAEEAQWALNTLVKFMQEQPALGFDSHDFMQMGKLMEKLKVQPASASST